MTGTAAAGMRYISVIVRVSSLGHLPSVRVVYSGRVDGDLSTEGYSLVDLRQT